MVRLALSSCRGQMAQLLIHDISHAQEWILSCVFSRQDSPAMAQPIHQWVPGYAGEDCVVPISHAALASVDILIDFSTPEWTLSLLPFCLDTKTKMVIGTTGFSAESLFLLKKHAQKCPVLWAPNMSIGMNVMYGFLTQALRLLDTDFSIGLFDQHHKKKKDSPSGTLKKMLSLIEEAEEERDIKFEKQVNVLRLGSVIGEHKVLFSGSGESIEMTHTCHDRRVFVRGALWAASFLLQKESGFFHFHDVLSERMAQKSES